ncbi:hypothetical protein [Lysinibacillus capsici]|uniref:hypothetical protein n=1 Tax=Lysinibacillus capsici TaxID=2115968 RepID=UPI002FDCEF1D
MGNHVTLTFIDNETPISFDLNKNTLFFGNNGKGKTRVLRTISLLHELIQQGEMKDIVNIIDSMYLKDLYINDINYKDLLENNEQIKQDSLVTLYSFIKKHKKDYWVVEKEIRKARNNIAHGYIGHSKSTYFNLNVFESREMEILKALAAGELKGVEFKSLKDFEYFLISIENILKDIQYSFNIDKYTMNNKKEIELFYNKLDFEIGFKVFNDMKEKYYLELKWENDSSKIQLENLSNIKNDILNKLASKRAYYISTENIEIHKTFEKIESLILSANSGLENWYWNNFDEKYFSKLKKERDSIINKFECFNKIMVKYGKICIFYDTKRGLLFSKQDRELSFEKLSSGERKLSFLFLEILFNDVDIYLIDEPEISVSLNFQNKLVIDLMDLTKSKKLFIATHAPFIFDDFKRFEGNVVKEVK